MERIGSKRVSNPEETQGKQEKPRPTKTTTHGPWRRYEKGRNEVCQAKGPLNHRVRLNTTARRDYFMGNIQIGHARKDKEVWTIFTHNGLEETSLQGVSFTNESDLHKWLLAELDK